MQPTLASLSLSSPMILATFLLLNTGCGGAVSPDMRGDSGNSTDAEIALDGTQSVRDAATRADSGLCHNFTVIPPEYTVTYGGPSMGINTLSTGGQIADGEYVLRRVVVYGPEASGVARIETDYLQRIAVRIRANEWNFRLLSPSRDTDVLGTLPMVNVSAAERYVTYGPERCHEFVPFAFNGAGYSQQPVGFDLHQACFPRVGYDCTWEFRPL